MAGLPMNTPEKKAFSILEKRVRGYDDERQEDAQIYATLALVEEVRLLRGAVRASSPSVTPRVGP
jgi:hypothetical protein